MDAAALKDSHPGQSDVLETVSTFGHRFLTRIGFGREATTKVIYFGECVRFAALGMTLVVVPCPIG